MKTRDRLVLGILAVAGVMAALWFAVLAPKREEASSLGAKVTSAEKRRDAANTKAAEAEKARSSYGRDYATVARLGKATPPQADVPSLVYQLESAARKAKVDFRAVTVEAQPQQAAAEPTAPKDAKAAATTPAGITSVPFKFKFEGSFFKLHELLRSVDRFSLLKGQTVKIKGRLLTLDSVKLTAGRKKFPQVSVEIVARAYVAPIPDQLPGTGQPTADPTPSTATQVTK
ncbi:MAG: hypothetical protein ACRDLS_08540 [Solirubrobacteraceae bacterium]